MQCSAGGQSLAAQEVWNSQYAELTLWVAGESLGYLHSHHSSCRLYLDICSCAVHSVTWVAELRESLELVLQYAWQSSRALIEMMQCSTAQDSSPQWTAHHADAECSSSTGTTPQTTGHKNKCSFSSRCCAGDRKTCDFTLETFLLRHCKPASFLCFSLLVQPCAFNAFYAALCLWTKQECCCPGNL